MANPKISDLSLFAAIRQFSEPAAWAELEQLLGLGMGTTEARDGWTENDWARRDYQVMLMLEAARKCQIFGTLRCWVQLTIAFRARLRSGELVATGYAKPVELACERTNIPADNWRFLKLDFVNGAASGEGLEIVSVRINSVESQASRIPDKQHSPSQQERILATEARNKKLQLAAEEIWQKSWDTDKRVLKKEDVAKRLLQYTNANDLIRNTKASDGGELILESIVRRIRVPSKFRKPR